MSSKQAVLLWCMLMWVLALGLSPAARADLEVRDFDGRVSKADRATPETQAGSHPFQAGTTMSFNGVPFEDPKTVVVDLPPGFVGNPKATQLCTRVEFGSYLGCPVETQVGVVATPVTGSVVTYGVFALEPSDTGVAAQFGFTVGGAPVVLDAMVRPDDYGLRITADAITQIFPVKLVSLMFWGVPADPRHNGDRMRSGDTCVGDVFDPGWPGTCGSGVGINAPPTAFVTLPSDCSAGPLQTDMSAESWQDPGDWKSASFISHDQAGRPIGVDGCDRLSFAPSFSAQPTTTAPDAPTGLDVKLAFRTEGLVDPGSTAEPPLKRAVVTLPDGMTINPAGADGLDACSDAQIGFGTDQPIHCPAGSKVGSVTATTPVLDEPVNGSVYLRSQNSADPASGEMFRIVLVVRNEDRGLLFKLPGSIKADPATGRLVTTFDNNPQLPVSELNLVLKSGARAPLVTPATCGTKTIDAELTSWAGQTVTRHDSYTIPCTAGLGGFAPSFSAGSSVPVGGAFSPFGVQIHKPDGNSDLDGLSMSLPGGLLARLKGVVGQQVGSVKTFAGPGSNPFMLPGKVFLEGRYGDAPFSLKVVVPAKAGPFDLGEVVVRQKIYVDPITAQVTVVSDPVPTIVKGVPVRLQRLEVDVDRPGFIVNPTSCAAKTVGATLGSAANQSVPVSTRFQVGDCGSLALKPSLKLSLSGKGQNKDGGHPAISATLTQPSGQSNLKKVTVKLPLSLALDPDNAASESLCSFIEGSKVDPKCPATSVVGKAAAVSPILNEPLTGPVYFTKNERKDPKSGRSIKTTPKLVIPLTGENGVKLTLTGASTVVDNQLVTTFDNIPDAQVSSFKMDITGGKKGILVISGEKADICKSTQIASQQIDGHNNKQADTDIAIQTPSCPTKIQAKKTTKKSVVLKVSGLGAGNVTVTGHGIKKTSKTITTATVATITAKRTKGKPGKVTVSFDPTGPAKARKTSK